MKYIKMFEKFKDISDPISEIDITQLSEAGKEAIKNRNIYSGEPTIAPTKPETEVLPGEETTQRPWRPVPTKKPEPGTEENPMGMMKYEEFRMGDVETAPVTAPPTTTPGTTPRPWRPIPTQKPKPGTEEKPMGTFDEVMSMFFTELNKVKDTSEGQEMLKNIEIKYGNI